MWMAGRTRAGGKSHESLPGLRMSLTCIDGGLRPNQDCSLFDAFVLAHSQEHVLQSRELSRRHDLE